jgi:hypothetical protein
MPEIWQIGVIGLYRHGNFSQIARLAVDLDRNVPGAIFVQVALLVNNALDMARRRATPRPPQAL